MGGWQGRGERATGAAVALAQLAGEAYLELRAGADVDAKTVEGRTALAMAAMRPDGAAVVKLLLEAKADAIVFVAKSWDYHVHVALEIPLEDNLAGIRESVEAAKAANPGIEIIARAQKELAAADRRVRELVPLRWWLVRFANGGQIGGFAVEPGTDLDVPPTHTYFAKPEGAADPPGWPSRTAAGEGVMQPIEGDEGIEHAKTRRRPATPSTSEEEIVDLSDPWFADAEGNPNPSTVN